MHLRDLIPYLICIFVALTSCRGKETREHDHEEAIRRVLMVQRLQNLQPGEPTVVPQITAIVDSMRADGRDACYYGAVNVLIDRLFCDGRYSEADSLAVRMQQEAKEGNDSLAIAMSKRVRAQILYKLSQIERAKEEALSALPYATSPLQSRTHFGTATSLNEWLHIIAQANSDTSIMRKAGTAYAEMVRENTEVNGWTDSTAHYPVTALSFEAENALLSNSTGEAEKLLDSAANMMRPDLPARAYEHFYAIRCRTRMARGDFQGALADVDTLLKTHACFPWFYLRDLQLKAEVENAAGMHASSTNTYSKYIAYHDSLSTCLTEQRLHDLTLLYRSELTKEEKRIHMTRLIGLGAVTMLLLILLCVTFRHTVEERKRNRRLVERLHEYDRTEQILLQTHPETAEPTEKSSDMRRLDRHMTSDRPYTNPALSRKELADHLGIGQDALAQMIRDERGCTVHAYINSFRTEEARRILDIDAEKTIAEIAATLGFGTARTLQRAFKDRFDMTPTQYREASKEIKNNEKQ